MPNPEPFVIAPYAATKVRAGRPRIVQKPWGRELIFAATDRFGGKILEIDAGQRLSLHLHRAKHEAFYVQHGRLTLWLGDDPGRLERLELEAGDTVDLPPGTVHRMATHADTLLVEVSSPELDDIVRLQDDYGRQDPASTS